MIDELLEKLRTAVSQASTLSDSARGELLRHVAAMEDCADRTDKAEDGSLKTDVDTSDTIGQEHPLKSLVASIEDLEITHPEITALVNRIAVSLGNMGI